MTHGHGGSWRYWGWTRSAPPVWVVRHADGATPAPCLIQRLVLQLKKDDRLPIIRNSRQGSGMRASPEGPERAKRVKEPAPAGLTPEGPQAPSPGSTV